MDQTHQTCLIEMDKLLKGDEELVKMEQMLSNTEKLMQRELKIAIDTFNSKLLDNEIKVEQFVERTDS